MGFFSRRNETAAANGTTAAPVDGHHHNHHTGKHAATTNDYGDPSVLNSRPPFGQWLKATWLDIITMVCMGAIGLGVYEAHPAPTRSFPVYFQDGEVVYPEFAYPLRKEIVPIWAAAMLGALVPIFIILCMQIRIRSFWDTNNAIIGLLYSLITAAVFQVFLKWLIGGLRPHFLDVCKPALPVGQPPSGNGFASIMYDRSICTGDTNQIDDSLESFPSGHSTAAFAGFVFLYLYLNAKLKVFSNYHPAMWKMIAIYAPILGATLIAGALTIDEFHNWYDVVAGAVIGTVMAFSAYRMVYASVWDFRFNHIPLTRHLPFSYGAGAPGAGGFHTAMFTRKAGWGHPDGAIGGAPFDTAAGTMGTGAAAGTHSGAGHLGGFGHHNHHGHGLGHRESISRRPVAGTEQMV
ncbi:acid phosphatase/Vanadium-dependent haloperoxidase [Xylona heveae TC161]|uniref:Acid phosphatase/Vanadium-dependent haloperoxidase n=1 Tax=Xylona heveae (strain CBS 132557 / TC161) TaxID=1328760 RepID=A0A164ZZ50_XYLHT|nr:acid phosphatase/Vanadium-dependent haloperoxidase [Xylona heveae TC161]KZF19730.1 acid phosphatase/Vanadium-dependent haloperoxidase [Xylona heveae TC161]